MKVKTETIMGQQVQIVQPTNLYKWARVWGQVQKNYYKEPVYLRREKQIEDFVLLNGFVNVHVKKDTDVFKKIKSVDWPEQADLILISDQKFSRLPCHALTEQVKQLLDQCPRLLLCLNRHYINIDNSYHDTDLSDHFPLAITQWLTKSLPNARVIDMSLDYLDRGDYFTWVIPDRIYYIEQCN